MLDCRQDENINGCKDWNPSQQPGPDRFWAQAKAAEQAGAEILIGDEVAGPPTEKTPKDQRAEDQEDEQNETGVHGSVCDGFKGLGGFYRRECVACNPPMRNVSQGNDVHQD